MIRHKVFIGLILALIFSSCASQQGMRSIASFPSANREINPPHISSPITAEMEQQMELAIAHALQEGPEVSQWLATDLYLKANDFQSRGDLRASVFLMKSIQKLQITDLFVQRKLAVDLIRLGELDEALGLLEAIRAVDKDEVMELIYAGVLTAQGKNDQARDVYYSVVKAYPQSEEACIFLVKSYVATEEFNQAYSLLDRCEKQIESPIFPYYRGKIAVDRQQWNQARKAFHQALAIDPEYYQAMVALALVEESQENLDAAIEHYQKIIEARPHNYAVLSRLVTLMFASEKYEEVIPLAEQLALMDPTDLSLKVRLGILHTDARNYERAIENFEAVLEAVPDSDKVLYYLGALYQEVQDYPRALHYFNQIPTGSNLFHGSHLQMAHILQALASEHADEYEQEFIAFISAGIANYESLKFEFSILKALFYESKEEYPKAISLVRSLEEHERFDEGHHYYLAALYEKSDDYRNAVKHIQVILEFNPNHAHALNFLGYTMLERNEDLPRAYKYIRRAVELKPEDGYIRDSLGWYYFKTGELKKALKEIKLANQLTQSDMVITKHLAIVYQALEDYDNAKKFYKEALGYCRHESERQFLIEALESIEQRRSIASEMP
jgi:tetratricopeptide (TPR) repeat protein